MAAPPFGGRAVSVVMLVRRAVALLGFKRVGLNPRWRDLLYIDDGEQLGLGATAPTVCLLQRDGESFTGLSRLRGSAGLAGLVCSCCCVRSVTVYDGGGWSLPHVGGVVAPSPGSPSSVCRPLLFVPWGDSVNGYASVRWVVGGLVECSRAPRVRGDREKS